MSTKGCYFLHDPGSPHLTIKYFLASNFNITVKSITHSSSAELSTLSVEDQLAEPSSFAELQQALISATLAQHIITPWNYSISALLGFMSSSRFCQASYQTGWNTERVTMLRRFIDRVFTVNASHWRSKLPFLTASEIGMLWQNWVLQIGGMAPPPAAAAAPNRGFNPSPRKQEQRMTYNTSRFANMPPRAGCETSAAVSTPPRAARHREPPAKSAQETGGTRYNISAWPPSVRTDTACNSTA